MIRIRFAKHRTDVNEYIGVCGGGIAVHREQPTVIRRYTNLSVLFNNCKEKKGA